MAGNSTLKKAFYAAFPHTIPILAGFLFLGIAYGIYMNISGFSPIYPIIMSATIFAGSVEFVAVGLLLAAFDPLRALLLTLVINARHLFYGISMLDRYKGTGRKKDVYKRQKPLSAKLFPLISVMSLTGMEGSVSFNRI